MKSHKGDSILVEYHVHVDSIKPWPKSQPGVHAHSVILQWENGGSNSGSFLSDVQNGKFEYAEAFRLLVTLDREMSGKGKGGDSFQKNFLELNVHELRKDKATKLLGTALINLAEIGTSGETTMVKAPLNFKRSFRNMVQPVMLVKIQAVEKENEGSELNEANEEEIDIASFTDDDSQQHPPQRVASSAPRVTGGSLPLVEGNRLESAKEMVRLVELLPILHSGAESEKLQVTSNACSAGSQDNVDLNGEELRKQKIQVERTATQDLHISLLESKEKIKQQGNGQKQQNSEEKHLAEVECASKSSEGSSWKRLAMMGRNVNHDEVKGVTSISSPINSTKNGKLINNNYLQDFGKTGQVLVADKDATNFLANERAKRKEKKEKKDRSSCSLDEKNELISRAKILEEELCEAAAVEAGLYSVVAQHTSSSNKVHTPARRLSRFYLHACKARSQVGRASAARAVVSGLLLVSKACGHEVPRLSFWLSNALVLRAIVSQALGEKLTGPGKSDDGSRKVPYHGVPFVQHEPSHTEAKNIVAEGFDDWEDLQAFLIVLERIETWIFSRIVESVWWQTLTPHMQSSAAKKNHATKGSNSRKAELWRYDLSNKELGNFSIELWEKAFRDACERLCPIRSEGHECGCLTVLARLVMEQLVNRLDVAMFNAILRESADEMPTDPVSDPICDSKVLPIPAGKSSFRAGAQLKNAVGSWSRLLTDLFDMDDSPGDTEHDEYKSQKPEAPVKAFPLLNALSGLMMLPLEMLADRSTRKEVCPAFGVVLIRRVLNNFVPDEFCPDPVPAALFESLDSEELLDVPGECITNFPCNAAQTVYSPPAAASLARELGKSRSQRLQRKGSSVLNKSYTSDDELNEMESPLTSIVEVSDVAPSVYNWMVKGSRNVVRYHILQDVWRRHE